MLALTKSLAAEWARFGVRCNAIAPGPFQSQGAQQNLWPDAEVERTLKEQIPLGRFAPYKGVSNEICHFWLARGLGEHVQELEPSERITVHRLPFAEARRRLLEQDCGDGQSMAGLLLFERWLTKGNAT